MPLISGRLRQVRKQERLRVLFVFCGQCNSVSYLLLNPFKSQFIPSRAFSSKANLCVNFELKFIEDSFACTERTSRELLKAAQMPNFNFKLEVLASELLKAHERYSRNFCYKLKLSIVRECLISDQTLMQ